VATGEHDNLFGLYACFLSAITCCLHQVLHLPTVALALCCAVLCCAGQVALLQAGRGAEVVQETRLWDEGRQETTSMRTKEGLADYRWALLLLLFTVG
jgi:hypothetical protein